MVFKSLYCSLERDHLDPTDRYQCSDLAKTGITFGVSAVNLTLTGVNILTLTCMASGDVLYTWTGQDDLGVHKDPKTQGELH